MCLQGYVYECFHSRIQNMPCREVMKMDERRHFVSFRDRFWPIEPCDAVVGPLRHHTGLCDSCLEKPENAWPFAEPKSSYVHMPTRVIPRVLDKEKHRIKLDKPLPALPEERETSELLQPVSVTHNNSNHAPRRNGFEIRRVPVGRPDENNTSSGYRSRPQVAYPSTRYANQQFLSPSDFASRPPMR